MKALSKPRSSPSRADKFPPPLMRFLRSNVGSRSSRGRTTRASPMFYLRSAKKRAPEITQEPSSPKVTCIGQVRVRRDSKPRGKRRQAAAVKRRRCWWLKRALICRKFSARFRLFRRVFWKWEHFFKSGYWSNASDYHNCNQHRETEADFLKSNSASPPKKGLIRTRCRSAPYRSSSLGGRLFWGTPLTEERDDDCTSQTDAKSDESSNSNHESKNSVKTGDDSKPAAGSAVHPLLLTRSKSEPARTGMRLDQVANFTA